MISLGNRATPVGTSTFPPAVNAPKLSQYSRAEDAPELVAQYSITSSSISSRLKMFSGCPSQSLQAYSFSTIHASWPTGESASP